MQKNKAVLVRMAPGLKRDVQRVARGNRRSTTEEIRIGLENHVSASADTKSPKK